MSPSSKVESIGVFPQIFKMKESVKEYNNYQKNSEWLRLHWKKIAREYAGKIIIVFDRAVVCSTVDADEARECLRSLESPIQAYVRYVPAANEVLLL